MTDEQIRKKIEQYSQGKPALIGFERCIGEIEFASGNHWYGIFPKGSKKFADDCLCNACSIPALIQYMNGALAYYNGTLARKLVKRDEQNIHR